MGQRIVLDEGVKVDATFEADRVGCGPSPGNGIKITSAIIDQACLIEAFGGKSPGVGQIGGGCVIAKAIIAVAFGHCTIKGNEGGDIAEKIVKRSKYTSFQFDGDSCSDFCIGS